MIETLLLVLPLMLSPGPANLVSFVFAARFGLHRILPFIFGISSVYVLVAIALGVGGNYLTQQYPALTHIIRLFGGAFIVYLGIQLLRSKHRNSSISTPSFWNGVTLQILNPKYPPVVLSVFVATENQNALITAGILSIVGMAGLLSYAASGTILRQKISLESQFRKVDYVFGLLLCLVGLWLIAMSIIGSVAN